MEQLSKISEIMQSLGQLITNDTERFLEVPIYYSIVEVMPDNMPTTGVVLEALPFNYDPTECYFERQLDIIIFHNTDYEREIILRLSKYAEDMIELLDEHILNNSDNYQLEFLHGSEIRALQNNRKDTESYKGAKTNFSSLIVLSYLLRY